MTRATSDDRPCRPNAPEMCVFECPKCGRRLRVLATANVWCKCKTRMRRVSDDPGDDSSK